MVCVKYINDNKTLRKWLDDHNHHKISLDVETKPSLIFYHKYREDWLKYLSKKLEPTAYKKEAKTLGKDPEDYKQELILKAIEPYNELLLGVNSIDKAREVSNHIISTLGISKPPVKIEDYFDGGERAALRYYYLEVESIQIYNGEHACYIDLEDTDCRNKIIAVLRYALENEVKILRAHNAQFDLSALHKLGINYKRIDHIFIYDTMIADHLLDERREHGLKKLAKWMLGKEDVMEYEKARSYGLKSNEWLTYSINDVVWCWDIAELQQPLLESEGLKKLYCEIESPFIWCVIDMKINGIQIDLDRLSELRLKTEKIIEELTIKLHTILNEGYKIIFDSNGKSYIQSDINFGSSQQLVKIFEKLGIEITETTPKGAKSVGKITLEKNRGNEFVDTLIKYKSATKLLNSYLSNDGQIIKNLDGDSKVRPSYRQNGTVTQRAACSQPNMQQAASDKEKLGVEFREIIISGENKSLIVSDFVAQENMLLAVITEDDKLFKLIKDGGDLHLANANFAYNLGIKEEDLFESSPNYNEIKNKFAKHRKKAKSLTFGVAYRISAYGLSKQLKCSEEEAQSHLDAYGRNYPKVIQKMKETDTFLENNGYVTSIFGYKRRFSPIEKWGKKIYTDSDRREAFNFLVQNPGAYMIKKAMYDIYKLIKEKPEYEIQIIMTTHDEVGVVCKEEYAEIVCEEVKKRMENCVKLSLPVSADTHIGKRYSDIK